MLVVVVVVAAILGIFMFNCYADVLARAMRAGAYVARGPGAIAAPWANVIDCCTFWRPICNAAAAAGKTHKGCTCAVLVKCR